jgi:hypothetical protein
LVAEFLSVDGCAELCKLAEDLSTDLWTEPVSKSGSLVITDLLADLDKLLFKDLLADR